MVTEDELYRSSSQFRIWNFTPTKLAALRSKANSLAKQHITAATRRRRKAGAHSVEGAQVKSENQEDEVHIDFLTADEERTMVEFYCYNTLSMVEAVEWELDPIVFVGSPLCSRVHR